MSTSRFPAEELDRLRALAAEWGKIVSKRAFGDYGPRLDVDFRTRGRIFTCEHHFVARDGKKTLFEFNFLLLGIPAEKCFALANGRHLRLENEYNAGCLVLRGRDGLTARRGDQKPCPSVNLK